MTKGGPMFRKVVFFVLILVTPLLADTIKIQYRYNRYLYQCPCGNEMIKTDRTQQYTCPICGAILGEGQYKDVGGTMYFTTLPPQEELDAQILTRVNARIYEIKHPPTPVEPTLTDYKNMRDDLVKQVEEYTNKIDELGAVEDLNVVKAEYEDRLDKVKDKIKIKEGQMPPD